MPNYRIIGADGMEYGPVSADNIRQWIAEGRVNSETKLQVEGEEPWLRLAQVPEFAQALAAKVGSTCPSCGERFEDGFDSCWKCGTGRDGSKPEDWPAVEAVPSQPTEACPKCGSTNVTLGKLSAGGHAVLPSFRPAGTRHFRLSLADGVDLFCDPSFACLDCGLVWDYLRPDELREFLSSALLSEGVRLESKGDTTGALARYSSVLENFPGTGAAKDAEFSIRNLKEKLG
jgi:GYF domain 2